MSVIPNATNSGAFREASAPKASPTYHIGSVPVCSWSPRHRGPGSSRSILPFRMTLTHQAGEDWDFLKTHNAGRLLPMIRQRLLSTLAYADEPPLPVNRLLHWSQCCRRSPSDQGPRFAHSRAETRSPTQSQEPSHSTWQREIRAPETAQYNQTRNTRRS